MSLVYLPSDDKGKAIEQVVFLELKRRGKEIYFFRERNECDFLVKAGTNVSEAIQVTQTLSDEKTKRRELRGLVDACREFDLKDRLIITSDTSQNFEFGKINIRALPLYRWLLSDN